MHRRFRAALHRRGSNIVSLQQLHYPVVKSLYHGTTLRCHGIGSPDNASSLQIAALQNYITSSLTRCIRLSMTLHRRYSIASLESRRYSVQHHWNAVVTACSIT
jgi:hypothetical protein